ncbi:uncharacterized protein Dvir_GJ26017, isoform A [Drosophila virilis]|uniref:Uncharacterized protein, isoform A n=1 Tax=Drosophila virilis TaxID=7244 RepID=A0A0Q9WA06_DROVI|nr:uncharacterized protein LOC26530787 isoform X1 [Drosophila virilis]KRF81532.1 uncharacterized protein Dvir_GJ26017, isoform A [Drosophila virilis]
METRSSLRFMHSEEEEDEDQLKRISMCFSIDISEVVQNRNNNFNNVVTPDQNGRNPGGGLFGAVEDKCNNDSSMSCAVPNKFFAESRSFLSGFDKYHRRLNATRRRSTMSFDHLSYKQDNKSLREPPYKPERYPKYNNKHTNQLPHRRNLMESYECPSRLNLNSYERNYNSANYKPNNERTHRKPKRELLQETLKEPFELGYNRERTRERDHSRKVRHEKYYEGNNNFYNAFYNCDFPTKVTDKSYKLNPSGHNEYTHNKLLNKAPYKEKRQASGYTDPNYVAAYNYYNPEPMYSPVHYGSEWDFYHNAAIPNAGKYYYPKPNRYNNYEYDYDCYEDPEMYRFPPVRRKSVDFFPNDCEIPYNILKKARKCAAMPKQRYGYPEYELCSRASAVEIPYKRMKRKYISSFDYEPELKCSDSGCDIYSMTYPQGPVKTYIEPWPPSSCQKSCHGYNPLTRPSHSQFCDVPRKCNQKSLKQKVSGFFKRSKCKSRIKCCRRHNLRYCCPVEASVCNLNRMHSKPCVDCCNSFSSISCGVRCGRYPNCPIKPSCCGTSIRKTRCAAYPTVYKNRCLKRCGDELSCMSCTNYLPKVNNSKFECENRGVSKCCSEYCRNLDEPSCQGAVFLQKAACVEATGSCGSADKDIAPIRCCCANNNADNDLGCGTYSCQNNVKEPTPCCFPKVDARKSCCSICSKKETPTVPSTINLHLTICTTSGNLVEPPKITTTLVEPVCKTSSVAKCQLKSSADKCHLESKCHSGTRCQLASRINSCVAVSDMPKPCCSLTKLPCCPSGIISSCKKPSLSEQPNCASSCHKIPSTCAIKTNSACNPVCSGSKCNLSMSRPPLPCNSRSNCRVTVSESIPPSPCLSRTSIACTENDFMSVRCNQSKPNTPKTSTTCIKTIITPKPILSTAKCEQPKTGCKKASTISFNIIEPNQPCKRNVCDSPAFLESTPYRGRAMQCGVGAGHCLNACRAEESCCCKCLNEVQPCKSVAHCTLNSPPATAPCYNKVELLCTANPLWKNQEACGNLCCPKLSSDQPANCDCRPSYVEDLKRELLDALRSEQRLNAQLQFQQPTPQISLFPCVPEAQSCPICPTHVNSCCLAEPGLKCWAPL